MLWPLACSAPPEAASPSAPPAPSVAAQPEAPTAARAAAPAPPEDPPAERTEPSSSPEPIVVREVKVPRDSAVLVVPGRTSTPIVYLHGRCGDPTAFTAWAETGSRFGTIVSLKGDQKCKAGGRTKWTEDPARLDRRITNALEAIRDQLGLPLDLDRRLVVGYSQGALRAESLGTRFPERYPRAVLVAGPRAPKPTSLTKSEAVLLLVGDHDARQHLSEAATKLKSRGRAVRYLELPGARHGEYGTEAARVFSEGLGWLVETPTRWRPEGESHNVGVP